MTAIFRPKPLIRKIPLEITERDAQTRVRRGVYSEWIITNGLGGYASGTIGGFNTRRFHGWLIAALPAPHGRTMMLNSLRERFYIGDKEFVLDCEDFVHGQDSPSASERSNRAKSEAELISPHLEEFRLETGLPIWVYRFDDAILEKRVCMVHTQNTTCIAYSLVQGSGRIEVQPALHVRPHDGALEGPSHDQYRFSSVEQGFELCVSDDIPALKLSWDGFRSGFHMVPQQILNLRYRTEQSRGYDWRGGLWSPGFFSAELSSSAASLMVSTEGWEPFRSVTPADIFRFELERKRRLLRSAPEPAREGFGAELVLAADQFLITPIGRTADQVRAHAVGDEIRSVIAGYHWFTDWGRDTMISLEGLTLATGRVEEAGYILRAFSNYIRNGLIPNLFPEGGTSGLYHTADATLWFFHAFDRYVARTGDLETLEQLLPKFVDIIEWHLRGTDFGIGVDHADGLLRQGAPGYQLTWMDAKVGDWVVTPRRGKAVEINALWYNALRLVCEWLECTDEATSCKMPSNLTSRLGHFCQVADSAYASFQRRFWNAETSCLFDVVDCLEEKDGKLVESADDPAIRPNQVIAIALKYPVLARERWKPVLEVVHSDLLTPLGLRSLSPRDKDFKSRYDGDLWTRDAAYHQGTVWPWLIGPFIDAWHRAWPEDLDSIRAFLSGFEHHLSADGVGTISEIFDAESPFTPRGCIAQAWSVAEVLRCRLLIDAESFHHKDESNPK